MTAPTGRALHVPPNTVVPLGLEHMPNLSIVFRINRPRFDGCVAVEAESFNMDWIGLLRKVIVTAWWPYGETSRHHHILQAGQVGTHTHWAVLLGEIPAGHYGTAGNRRFHLAENVVGRLELVTPATI